MDGFTFRLSFLLATKHHSIQYGELAQLGERLVCNQEVTGSSPVFSTSLRRCAATAGTPSFSTTSLKRLVAPTPQGGEGGIFDN